MKQRKSLYDKAKQTQVTNDWREYRKAQNQVNKALSAAYQQYCTHCLIMPTLTTIRGFGL